MGLLKKVGDLGKAKLKSMIEAEKRKAEANREVQKKYQAKLKVEREKAYEKAMVKKAKMVAKQQAEAKFGIAKKKKKVSSMDMGDITKGMIK